MSWFTRRKRNAELIAARTEYSGTEELNENRVPISREKFVLDDKVLGNLELPIYGIYQRLQEDWETKGYKDATEFPETSYRENQKRVIIDQLRLAIKEALIRYEDKIADIDTHIDQAEKNGLIETLETYKQERKKLVTHHEDLSTLDEDAKKVGEKTQPILISYDMGFMRGLVSLSNEKVNEIMNK